MISSGFSRRWGPPNPKETTVSTLKEYFVRCPYCQVTDWRQEYDPNDRCDICGQAMDYEGRYDIDLKKVVKVKIPQPLVLKDFDL